MVAKDITYFLHEVAQKYGPVAQVWLGARPWIVVSDPGMIRKVAYRSTARPLTSNSFSHLLVGEPDEVDAESCIWNRGPAWKASRRAFEASIMHASRLAGHVPAIRRCIDRFVGSHLRRHADSGEALDMKKAFGVLSLAIVGEVAYGVDFWTDGESGASKGAAAELIQACFECFHCLNLENATAYLPLQLMLPSLRPLWLWLAKTFPDGKQRRHMAARQKVADVSRHLMEVWRRQAAATEKPANGDAKGNTGGQANGGDGGGGVFARVECGGISSRSFLAAMLGDRQKASKNGPEEAGGKEEVEATEVPRMSDIQVISQGLTFIMAGYDTTSSTLAHAVFCLASFPAVQERLRQELASLPGCVDDMEKLGQLPYLDAVVKESQRLYPVGTFVWRELTSELDLGAGMVLPRDAFVCLSLYNVHQDPQQWPQPERFLPERFLPETKGALGPADPNAFVPFGLGPRMCVGYKLATLVVKATLAALLLRFKVELHPSQKLPLRLKTTIVLEPADGVWVTLTKLE